MTLVRSLFVWLCCLAALAPARGRSEDQIVTDGPDFVESSLTVGKGRFQVETSSHLRQSDDGHRYAAGSWVRRWITTRLSGCIPSSR